MGRLTNFSYKQEMHVRHFVKQGSGRGRVEHEGAERFDKAFATVRASNDGARGQSAGDVMCSGPARSGSSVEREIVSAEQHFVFVFLAGLGFLS